MKNNNAEINNAETQIGHGEMIGEAKTNDATKYVRFGIAKPKSVILVQIWGDKSKKNTLESPKVFSIFGFGIYNVLNYLATEVMKVLRPSTLLSI